MTDQILVWGAFNLFVLGMLALDLGVFHRKAHEIHLQEALVWSGVWIGLALLFNLGVYLVEGPKAGLEFLSAYLIEKSLSVDNLFVFLMIFSYFGVPALYQHKVLFWGILAALIMRAVFIALGIALIHRFHWVIYVFGGFLVLTGIKMALQGDKKLDLSHNPVLRLCRRFLPVTESYEEGRFFVKKEGRLWTTPLFVVLILVNVMDVIFAVDSVPAVFAVSLDPFIVYSSNVFAILGLRALYFALAGLMPLFYYLNYGLSAILVFVGIKMLLMEFYKIPIGLALGGVAGILFFAIGASVVRSRRMAGKQKRKEDVG